MSAPSVVRVAQAFLISTWALDIVILFFTAVFLVSADTTTTVDDADGQRAPSPAPASGGGGGGGAAAPAASTAAQSGYHSPTEPAMDGYPEAVLIGIYGAVILMPVWSLCGYHAFLIAQGETTKERIVANRHKEAERDGAGLRATRSAGQEGRQAQRQAGIAELVDAQRAATIGVPVQDRRPQHAALGAACFADLAVEHAA